MSKLDCFLLCSRQSRRVGYLPLLVAIMLVANATVLVADVQSIQWHEDEVFDGVVTGTLAGHDVRLSSPNGPFNGGRNLKHPAQWWGAGTNGVPGLALAHQEAAAIDWLTGEVGTVEVDLGTSVEDPIFMFAYLDGSMTFDFDDSLSLKLVDHGSFSFDSEAGAVIDAGNVVRTTGHTNNSNDGFAVAVKGTLSSLNFQTNLDLNAANSVSFSMVDCNPTLGDFNCDGAVSFNDFLIVRDNFGQSVEFAWEGDADGNRIVDFTDFLVVSDHFGSTQGAAVQATAVPEPAGTVLAGFAVMGLLARRRASRNT